MVAIVRSTKRVRGPVCVHPVIDTVEPDLALWWLTEDDAPSAP